MAKTPDLRLVNRVLWGPFYGQMYDNANFSPWVSAVR